MGRPRFDAPAPVTSLPHYLTVRDVAKWLGVHEVTIRQWIAERKIPCVRVNGRMIRFDVAHLRVWIEEQRVRERTIVRPYRTRKVAG